MEEMIKWIFKSDPRISFDTNKTKVQVSGGNKKAMF